MSLLHSHTLWCYNTFNKDICILRTKPLTIPSSEGFFSADMPPIYLSLRLRNQCANSATIQPLMTVVVMWTKISVIFSTSSLRQLDAWEIGDSIIISFVNSQAYALPISWIMSNISVKVTCVIHKQIYIRMINENEWKRVIITMYNL